MKTIKEITESIKFPQLTDIFDQPIKPGDILLSHQNGIAIYGVTHIFNLKTQHPYIVLIYIDIKQKYKYIMFDKAIISMFSQCQYININNIVPENTKNIADAYFNLSKNKTIKNYKNLETIETKTIFNMLNA